MNAALSVDLDNRWTYLKTHGDLSWQTYPSYLSLVIPRILEIMDYLNLKVTFFVVAKDTTFDENKEALSSITDYGHDVGNHSVNHEPWLHRYSEKQISYEISQAHALITEATGQRPIGFRGPGFSLSSATLKALINLGYIFDATTFPTFLGPLARLYYFSKANLHPKDRKDREKLFGSWNEGLRPLKPYHWNMGNRRILEVPVTTLPIIRIPFHVSYFLYISSYSITLAKLYFKTALSMCKLRGVEPSLLLHPLDFLGKEDLSDLAFFPAMDMAASKKLSFTRWALEYYSNTFRVLSLNDYALKLDFDYRSGDQELTSTAVLEAKLDG